MPAMEFLLGFVVGAVVGAGLAAAIMLLRSRAAGQAMRETFAALAAEALDANARRLAEQSGAALDGKKALIDQSVAAINDRLERVRQFLQSVESSRKEDLGRLSTAVGSLTRTAEDLHRMLASTQRRGLWGERMAEDVLRLAGLQEGVNYRKQSAADADSGKPDYTFFLPNDLKVNMDVKFPLERYRAYLDADGDAAKAGELRELVAAVRGHVSAVAKRGYIDPKVPTVPYVIVFLPSEQVYGLVLQTQPDLIDEALTKHVVLVGPLTLYAVLAVMRQAAESANLLKTADEVLALLGDFLKQWESYKAVTDRMGRRIEDAKKEYDTLVGTRTRMLERPLARIDDLRKQRGLPDGGPAEPAEDRPLGGSTSHQEP